MVSTTVATRQYPTRTEPRHPLRFVTAALLLATAGIHLPIIGQHLHEAPYIGVLFIVLAVTSSGLAALLLLGDRTTLVWAAAVVVPVSAVAAYLLSRSVGLPQIGDDVGNWDPLGIAAISVELATAAIALRVLLLRSPALGRSRG